jgi:hypothetical protein
MLCRIEINAIDSLTSVSIIRESVMPIDYAELQLGRVWRVAFAILYHCNDGPQSRK